MKKYLSEKNVIRILVTLVVILSITAGYFQAIYSAENTKYLRLEDKYVRVRQQLGVDQTQYLIDLSYEGQSEKEIA